jgi:hypothetical protein
VITPKLIAVSQLFFPNHEPSVLDVQHSGWNKIISDCRWI